MTNQTPAVDAIPTAPLPPATILGYPRIGPDRELKRAVEAHWRGDLDVDALRECAAALRAATRAHLRELGLTGASAVPADFTYYDQVLQVTTALGALPRRFADLRGGAGAHPGTSLPGFFTAARGEGERAALEMTKWFDSNYHYLVPELDESTPIDYVPGFGAVDPTDGPAAQVLEALAAGEEAPRPVVVGPVTYLLLAKASDAAGDGFRPLDRLADVLDAYGHMLADLWAAGAQWVQLDEPALVCDAWDVSREEVLAAAADAYTWIAAIAERPRVLVAGTYGPLGDALPVLAGTGVEAIGLDLVAGELPPAADLALRPADRGALARVMDALEFRTLHQRAQRILTFSDNAGGAGGTGGTAGEDSPAARLDALEVAVLGRDLAPGALGEWIAAHLAPGDDAGTPLGLDVAGTLRPGQADATAIALSDSRVAVVVDPTLAAPEDESALAGLLGGTGTPLVVTDAKGAWHALHARGLPMDGVVFDPALAGYLCRPEQRGYDVGSLAQRWLGIDLEALGDGDGGQAQTAFDLEALSSSEDSDAVPAQALAAARHAAVQGDLAAVLERELRRREAEVLFTELEMPVAATLAEMEDAGIAVDEAVLIARETELDARVNHAAEAAYAAAGHELNLSSPKQLQTVLFDELDMPRTRRTKTGYTTDAGALAALYARTGHPFLAGLLEHRDAIKLRQTVEGLRKAIQADGRIRTTFQQTITATGRLSSTDPNLQNIPARTEEGMRIREAFTVGRGYECLVTADYSQIEMRIMAHLSGDEALIEAFRSGEDLHRYVAALVHDIEVGEVTGQQRSHVKAMSYGLAYGLSTYGLAKQLGIDNAEAAALRDAYFARFGRVHDYLEGVVEQARRDGYTQTMFGRRRYLPDLTSDNRQRREMAERAALNAPIQGSAADIVKKAMIDVAQSLQAAGLGSRLLLQIHDELLVEVAPGEAAAVEDVLRRSMASAAELSVPLDVSIGRGGTWRDAAH